MTGNRAPTATGDTLSPPRNLAGALRPYPEYKESKLPWMGKIPQHWTEERAKYFFREVDERSKTGDEELLSVSHMTGVTPRSQKNITMFKAESYAGYKLCKPRDLVINTMWAWMGALGVSKYLGIVSSGYGVYRPLDDQALLSEYIDSLLRIDPYRSEYYCRSTGIRSSRFRLYPEQFLRMPLICPPHEEQEKIMAFLQMKDRQIKRYILTKRQLIGVLNEQKQVIINHAVTGGIDPNIRLKPSGIEWLGDVPEHWEVQKISQLFKKIGSGTTPDTGKQEYYGGDIKWINTGDLNDSILTDCQKTVTKKAIEDFSVLTVYPKGSFIVALYGATIGKTCITDFEACTNQACCVLSKPYQKINIKFLMNWFFSFRPQLIGMSYGGGQPNISQTLIRSLRVPVPPHVEQDKIVAFIDGQCKAIELTIENAKHEIDLIREYRNRLIANVVTGKVDVRSVQIQDEMPVDIEDIEDIDVLDDNGGDNNDDGDEDEENDK